MICQGGWSNSQYSFHGADVDCYDNRRAEIAQAGAKAMQVVEVVDGQGRRRQVPLDRPRLLIGREPSCDIHLPHPGVSRRHAQLQRTDQGRWLLQDLSSRNHVYVENRPVQQIVLEARKPFRIAEYWLALLEAAPEAGPETEPEVAQDDTAQTNLGQEAHWPQPPHIIYRGL